MCPDKDCYFTADNLKELYNHHPRPLRIRFTIWFLGQVEFPIRPVYTAFPCSSHMDSSFALRIQAEELIDFYSNFESMR